MRLRVLAFLPPAALMTAILFLSASSLVSAIEGTLVGTREAPPPIRVERFETECDALYRELHALSHEVTDCEVEPACEDSPLLCPAALDREIDREFQRLRDALHERCDFSLGLMDYAWSSPTEEGALGAAPSCGRAHDWLEAKAKGEARPTRFEF